MSILGGVMCRAANDRIDDAMQHALMRALSRNPDDEAQVFRDSRVLLAKIDIGAYGCPAFRRDPSGSVSIMAGEPSLVLDPADAPRNREQDLALLHAAWDRDNWAVLRDTTGTFCAAHYQPATRTLTLIADKVGVRPLYYSVGPRYVVFATALRILEQLAEVPKRMNLRAITEMVTLGCPLGARTPYADVARLRPGEIIRVDRTSVSHSSYWRWDTIAPSTDPEAVLLREAHTQFDTAVARRSQGDTASVAFLSGGLDSRSVVGALRARSIDVYTINFATSGTQDRVFARQFAERIGTHHREMEFPRGIDHTQRKIRLTGLWMGGGAPGAGRIDRPRMVWSGDGGSMGFGHVYMSRPVVQLFQAGKEDAGIEAFLAEQYAWVPQPLLREHVANQLTAVPTEGLREELRQIHCRDRGRALYLFLLLNGQRWHMTSHFEDLDLHRLEFHLPFFDARFLELVISLPIDWCLEHRFYTKWLRYLPAAATAVPWQTYPGHEPCPVPAGDAGRSQWDRVQLDTGMEGRKRALLQQADEMLSAIDFPEHLLRRPYLRFRTFLYRTGIRDYSYVIANANTYFTYWRRSTDAGFSGARERPLATLGAD